MTELTEEMRKDGALDTITISRADAEALLLATDERVAVDRAHRILRAQLEGKA